MSNKETVMDRITKILKTNSRLIKAANTHQEAVLNKNSTESDLITATLPVTALITTPVVPKECLTSESLGQFPDLNLPKNCSIFLCLGCQDIIVIEVSKDGNILPPPLRAIELSGYKVRCPVCHTDHILYSGLAFQAGQIKQLVDHCFYHKHELPDGTLGSAPKPSETKH